MLNIINAIEMNWVLEFLRTLYSKFLAFTCYQTFITSLFKKISDSTIKISIATTLKKEVVKTLISKMRSYYLSKRNSILRSIRPGLIKAGSKLSIRFVAMITFTSPLESNPSKGACSSATRKSSRTNLGPSPRYFWINSDPTTRKNVADVWLATAFASKVLPVPGGPYRMTPLGGLIPISS
ncbi:hypothetical protein BpHYR1_004326 [Brachionus plicatilis]|uniref:Uncharacterized protein n=1 Tax=Brachionus plicatilis TaxID=10195 RepID=A0A3M7SDQ8_BRAPC|nr:hypothetical protein BpHYR1_004326 [Brachionus plicatilis]